MRTETVLAARGDRTPGAAFAAPCHRIPALASSDGRLIAAWDVRQDWRDLPGAFDLVSRTSDDGGHEWAPVRVLRAHTPGLAGVAPTGFGDASLTWDAGRRRLVCWHVASHGRSFFTAEPAPGVGLSLWCSLSDDGGHTWRHVDWSSLRPAGITGMFAASGNGICLRVGARAGRLVQPMVMRDVEGRHWAVMALSDDGGLTWRLGERIGPDCDENKVVELADGRLLLHARSRPRRRQAYSSDGGETFTAPVPHPALVDPACNGGLVRVGDVLVCSLLDDETARRRLVLRTSVDDGATWSTSIVVDEGAAAYSVLVALDEETLGLAWEAGDYDALLFRRIALAELGLDGAQATLSARASAGDAAADPEVAPDGASLEG